MSAKKVNKLRIKGSSLLPVSKRYPAYVKNIELKTVVELKTGNYIDPIVDRHGDATIFMKNYLGEWEGIDYKILFPENK